MSNLIVGIEGAAGPSSTRAKRRLLWRGLRRRLVRNLKRALDVITNMDAREASRGEEVGYNPVLFAKNPGSAEDRAMTKLINRCKECLSDTA